MASSPTARTLEWCRKQGYAAGVTERFNRFAKVRQDLFGIVDLIFLTGELIVGVQCTVTGSLSARKDKIFELHQLQANNDAIHKWLSVNGASIELHGWAKRGERGKRKLWTLKRKVSVYNTTTRELKFIQIGE